MNDPGAVVYGLLQGLVGGRVYPQVRAWGTILPAITYSVSSDERETFLAGYSNRRHVHVSITTYASTYAAACSVATSVDASMQSWSTAETPEGTGVVVSHIRRNGRSDSYEETQDGSDDPIHLVESDFIITIEEQ